MNFKAYHPLDPLPYFRGLENQIASWVMLLSEGLVEKG